METGIIIAVLSTLSFLIYASANIRSGVYLKTFSRLHTNRKILALTFDDGPHPGLTPQVLDVLKKHHVQAVFFCIGKNLEANRPLAERIIAEGHRIGNHTNNHRWMFPFLSAGRMRTEIEHCADRISNVSPADSPVDSPEWFRPPFGITNPSLKKALKHTPYTVVGWDVRSLDTVIRNPDAVVRRVTKKMRPGSILLFHDTQKNTPYIVEQVILAAKKKEYSLVRIDKMQ